MARLTKRESIYKVADRFRDRCLVKGCSLLWPSHSSWTADNLTTLWSAFIEHPDEGPRSFFEKWKDQLASQPKDIHRIAADVIVLYCLFPSRMRYDAKIASVLEVISWKLADEKPEWDLVNDAFSTSIGFPGPYYQTGRPWQIAFYIEYCRRIRLGEADPFDHNACKQVADAALERVPGNATAARHVLLHLLFPDHFERIASERQKHQIVNAFRKYAANIEDVDNALASIRRNLIQRSGRGDTDFDFYNSDIRPRWQFISGKADTEVTSQKQKWWIEKTYVEGNPDRIEGEYALGRALWSPRRSKSGADVYRFTREIEPGDAVLHLTDNDAFTGFSFATGKYEEFGGVPDTEWGEGASYIVRLRDFERLSPLLSRDVFFASPFKERLVELIETGHTNLFYNREPSLNQGAYLTPAPPELIAILDDAYRAVAGTTISDIVAGKRDVRIHTWADVKETLAYDFEDTDLSIKELYFEDKARENLVRQIKTALKNGKHIILIGPPGTGKSKLAKEICDFYCGSEDNYIMATATSDWSTYETIGGYRPLEGGNLRFFPGLFLQCFRNPEGQPVNRWIIIDELNRADIDKAFGSLFSALTGDDVTLPFEINEKPVKIIGKPKEELEIQDCHFMIHPDWRIIATMNTYDKSSLYEMSYAFMRRLAFVPVEVPTDITGKLIEEYVRVWGLDIDTEICSNIEKVWKLINSYREIGPSIVEDIYKYVQDTDPSDYGSAVIMYVLPQFEGLLEQQAINFAKEIVELDFVNNKDELIRFAAGFFGIDIRKFD